LGIDGAAHRGALEALRSGQGAGPVGVVASGVDVAYPRGNSDLWEGVAAAGAVISETLPGRAAQAWRFPARNRVIAGLVRLVVVVESRIRGGSLITVEAALQRGVEVRAVPGSVHSPASAGTNQLLYEGAGPVRDATDVLDSLGVTASTRRQRREREPDQKLDKTVQGVLDAVGWRSATANQLVSDTDLTPPEVMRCLDVLVGLGIITEDAGCYTRIR
jgi:DNA processing protein